MRVLWTEQIDLEDVANLCESGIKRRAPQPRDFSAWHVTNLLESIELIAKGSPAYYDPTEHANGRMSFGRIWESAVDCYLSNYAVSRGGVYIPDMVFPVDDIVASLDGVMMIPDIGWSVCECKLRFGSDDSIPEKHVRQMQAYCHVIDVNLVHYISANIGPDDVRASIRLLEFPRHTVTECWESIISTKHYLESRGMVPQGRKHGSTIKAT